ncbi:hypothetical protein [uncultured Duncaniella sp.]|uniref:hypothetical protein n=1 Tax=uncultured Duncaniella sp. TaxID=2768039 RepID=UPI00345AC3D9
MRALAFHEARRTLSTLTTLSGSEMSVQPSGPVPRETASDSSSGTRNSAGASRSSRRYQRFISARWMAALSMPSLRMNTASLSEGM